MFGYRSATTESSSSPHVEDATEKETENWVTGDEPMTGAQRSYIETLAREAGEDVPEEVLTKAEASALIERLQAKTGREAADGSDA